MRCIFCIVLRPALILLDVPVLHTALEQSYMFDSKYNTTEQDCVSTERGAAEREISRGHQHPMPIFPQRIIVGAHLLSDS